MKNQIAFLGIAILLSITFSCKEKNAKDSIRPEYGATGNPYPENQTVTGSTTYTSPATINTSLKVAGTEIGWSNPSCLSTGNLALRATKDNIDVMLTFSSPITNTTYVISTVVAPNSCQLTVLNAPGQPAGIIWYGKSGTAEVSTSSTSINAQLKDVVCTQKDFGFPQVGVTGAVGCTK